MNLKSTIKAVEDERRAIHRLIYGEGFWRPVLQRWLIWAGCSWAVVSAIWLCPKLIKIMAKSAGM